MPKIKSLQANVNIQPTQFTIEPTSTTNQLELVSTYSSLLTSGQKLYLSINGIWQQFTVGDVVETSGGGTGTINLQYVGAVNTPPTFAFSSANITSTNGSISSSTFTASANNADITTNVYALAYDYQEVAAYAIIQPIQFTIDGTSTTGNIVLLSNDSGLLSNGDKLIVTIGGVTSEIYLVTVNESPYQINVNFNVQGASDNPPTYAFNSSNITTAGMTISGNQATATANSASATTLNYVASADNVESIAATATLTLTPLTIDGASTTSSLVLESPENNLLPNGSSLIVDQSGVISQVTSSTVVKTNSITPTPVDYTINGDTTLGDNYAFTSLTVIPVNAYISENQNELYQITGAIDSPPLYALNSTTIPTVTNVTVSSNVATANANSASLTSWNYETLLDVESITSEYRFTPTTFTIDGSSTTSSLVLDSASSGLLSNGNSLLLDISGSVDSYVASSIIESPITNSEYYEVTGATDTPPTYAFNSSNVTVSNMTIASNVATATANSASATTFEYTASGDVTEAQAIAILQPTELEIDPSSTTGSIKLNYTTNNLLQVGSKILVTDGGVTTEETITAGSQVSVGGWTQRTQPSPARTLYCITYGNGLFVAAGTDGKIVTSTDGITWTNQTSGYSFEFDAITYGNGIYVAVTQDASNSIFTSTDGVTWTKNLTVSLRLWAVAYGGGLFVAAGNDGALITSPDGLTWTNRTSGFTSGQRCSGVAYGNGTWIVVNEHTTNISTSTDGVTWTIKGTSGAITTPLLCVTYGNGVWVIGGNNAEIATSSDTNTWIARTSNLTAGGSSVYSVRAAIFANNRFYITAFSLSFSNCISTSPDGITWTGQNAGFASSRFYGLAYGVNKLVAVGDVANQSIMTLSDTTYQFTITSPSLPVPDAMYLGGQVLQSNVGGAGWVTHTVTYSDSSGTITFTGNNRTGLTGDTVQIRMTTINDTEVLSYFRSNITTLSGYRYTCSGFTPSLSAIPTWAAKGGQQFQSSISTTTTPSFVTDTVSYSRLSNLVTANGSSRAGLTGKNVQFRINSLNNNDIVSYLGANLGLLGDNTLVATSNNASGTTFSYVASNNISQIQPIVNLKPVEFVVNPSSTIGNLIVSSTTSGLIVNGSKILVNQSGTVSEVAVDSVSESGSYDYTITSTTPTLIQNVPDAVYLGGQVLQSTVNTGTPSWNNHTVTYTDLGGGVIQFIGNNLTSQTGTITQIRLTNINDTEILSYYEANLVEDVPNGNYTYTCSGFTPTLTSVPTWVSKGGQTLQSSVSTTTTPSFVTDTISYTRNTNQLQITSTPRTGQTGLNVRVRMTNVNQGDIISQLGADLVVDSGYQYVITNPSISVPTNAFKGGQVLEFNDGIWNEPAVTYTVNGANVTITGTNTTGLSADNIQLRLSNINNTESVTEIGADITSNIPQYTYACSELTPTLNQIPIGAFYGNQQLSVTIDGVSIEPEVQRIIPYTNSLVVQYKTIKYNETSNVQAEVVGLSGDDVVLEVNFNAGLNLV